MLLLVLFGCNSENAIDCFQRTGDIVSKTVEVPDFTRILVLPNVELILKEGPETEIIIQSGEHLINEVNAWVEDDRLIVEDTNDCNFARDFNQTKVFVTAPNISQIRSATQFDISSDGVLSYPSLSLISEDFNEDNGGNLTGTFHIEVDTQRLGIVSNNIASFFISGNVETLFVGFYSGTGRFEGADLIAQDIEVFHRGTNKMILNPQQSISGELRSTGDVIAMNRPSLIDVQEYFTGTLIFED